MVRRPRYSVSPAGFDPGIEKPRILTTRLPGNSFWASFLICKIRILLFRIVVMFEIVHTLLLACVCESRLVVSGSLRHCEL